MVLGEIVRGQPANVLLFEGARPAQVKLTPHTHTQVLTIHRELDEQLKAFIEENAKRQGD
jgi:predicted esterase